MGSPPRVKIAPMPTSLVKSPLLPRMDSGLSIQEEVEEASQPGGTSGKALAQAVPEQSKALTTLVSQLESGDPLLDSQQGASGTSLGSRGSAGRHQLQTELPNRSGHFFLQVTQNARYLLLRLLDGELLGKIRWLRWMSRNGAGPICSSFPHLEEWADRLDPLDCCPAPPAPPKSLSGPGAPAPLWAYRSGGSLNPQLRAFAPLCPQ